MTLPTTFATTHRYPFEGDYFNFNDLPLALPYCPTKPKQPPLDLEALYDQLDQAESLVFLDTESTSGGNRARLIEVACVEYTPEGKLISGLHFRCNPHRRSTASAKRVHGIADCELEHCKEFRHYAETLRSYLKGKLVVIHDQTLDLQWLNKEFLLIDPKAEPIESTCKVVDSLRLAKALPSDRRKNGLDALIRWYGFERTSNHHDAYSDANYLSKVFFELWWDLDDHLFGDTSEASELRYA